MSEVKNELPVLEAKMSAANLLAYNNAILGRILGILEAVMVDSGQADATRRLVKQTVWDNYDLVRNWMNDQTDGKSSTFPFQSMNSVE